MTAAQIAPTADADWTSCALTAIRHLASSNGKPFTAADVSVLMGREPEHPSYWGSVFALAKHEGLIRRIGYAPSARPGRKGGVCALWSSLRAVGKQPDGS